MFRGDLVLVDPRKPPESRMLHLDRPSGRNEDRLTGPVGLSRGNASKAVEGAEDTFASAVQDVSVDHRGADVVVAKQLLDGADVVAVFQEVGGEGVAEGVAGGPLGDTGFLDGVADGALHDRFVMMVAAALAGIERHVGPGGREDPLPGPFAAGVGVFAAEGVGEFDPAAAARQVVFVLAVDAFEVASQGILHGGGQHGDAVLLPFAVPDEQLVGAEVDVFGPQAQGFEQAQAGAVEQRRDQEIGAGEALQDLAHFGAAQDDWQALGGFGARDVLQPAELMLEDFAVQKQQRAEGLRLGAGAHLPVNRKGGQEAGDLLLAHLVGVAAVVKQDVPADPALVRFLGPPAVMSCAQFRADPFEQPGFRTAAAGPLGDGRPRGAAVDLGAHVQPFRGGLGSCTSGCVPRLYR